MNDRNKIEYIRNALQMRTLFEQLAEECAELSQASLKLIRALGNGNPTPVDYADAYSNLLEEAIDVQLVLEILQIPNWLERESLKNLYAEKLDRWYGRVKEVDNDF